MLTRARGRLRRRSSRARDLIVELIGGIEPARDYVLRALRAGRHVVTANKQLLSQHGEELWAAAREHGVQLRFEAAVAGVVPVIRVLAGVARRRPRRARPRDRQRHDELHPHRDGAHRRLLRGGARARRSGSATPRPTRPTTSTARDAAAKMAILARLAFGTPVHLDQVRYEGIEHITADDLEYARELGLGLKLIGTAERVDGGLSRARAPGLPLRRPPAGLGQRPVQRGHRRVRRDHRDHDVAAPAPAARRPRARCSATSSRR